MKSLNIPDLLVALLVARPAAGKEGVKVDVQPNLHDRHAKKSCRVAVCLSGHVRSFVRPVVHLSVRHHVIEAIKADGCSVDVFAYAALGGTATPAEQEHSGYTSDKGDVEASMQVLAPTRLVWHQEQAETYPTSCPETLSGGNTSAKEPSVILESGGSSEDDWKRTIRNEHGPDLYWQLYMSRAAYRMVLEEERERNSVYDWIVHARFDATWIRPIPPLSLFSREAVWLDARSWPSSDDFALVPRAYSDRFFSTISTFYACDSSSWPPTGSWWNPRCDGKSLGESVLFRHLHASEVDYRVYPMFDYVPTLHEQEGSKCAKKKSAYASACVLLDTWGLVPPSFSGGVDCTTVLSEWSNLRCETLMSDTGIRERWRAEDILLPGLRAWEHLLETPRIDGTLGADLPAPENLRVAQLKLAALRDALVLVPSAFDETSLGSFGSTESGQGRWELSPAWLIHSQEGCDSEEHAGRTPHLVRHYSVEPSLAQEMALAMKCFVHLLVEGAGAAAADFDATRCTGTRPLELVMIDVSARSAELGICTADGSLGLSTGEHVQLFFADPAAYCVGYGRMLRQSPAIPPATAGGADEGTNAVVDVPISESISQSSEGVTRGVAAITGTAVREVGETEVPVSAAAAVEPDRKEASVSRVLRKHSPGVASVEALDLWKGGGRSTNASITSATCSDLKVQAMTVAHPKEGAVYWEGPVTVELELTLIGTGLRGLDSGHVHICADTEESWPVLDWSRSCVTLEQLASPEWPFLMFGSTIGVVVGSISVRDARPACIPEGSLRGPILPMEQGLGDGEVASTRVRFKVIHHKSGLERRGRPLGPFSLGRGFSTTEEYIQDLQREADEEADAALDEMQSYTNLSHGLVVELRRDKCSPRVKLHQRPQMHQRGTSLVASGFQLQFHVEQLDWMLANGKLPMGMAIAADRMRELQLAFPDDTTPSFFTSYILEEKWRSVAPFFQKALLFPAPTWERVVSTSPLHTWEYDEIPWMEALNPELDWPAIEKAYLVSAPVELTHIDNFFSHKALAVLLDMARGSTFFFDHRPNYLGAYPTDGMSHPLLYQIAEEAAERLPRIVGRGTPGWPLVQSWIYIYGGNDEERCAHGIKVHADNAMVNMNVWLAPDSANLGSAETNDGGGLTVFHAKSPDNWSFQDFNENPDNVQRFLEENDAGNTSVPHRQNRALLFDSALFHQSDPFRFKKGFENKRINLTLLFGPQQKRSADGMRVHGGTKAAAARGRAPLLEPVPGVSHTDPGTPPEVPPEDAGVLWYCL